MPLYDVVRSQPRRFNRYFLESVMTSHIVTSFIFLVLAMAFIVSAMAGVFSKFLLYATVIGLLRSTGKQLEKVHRTDDIRITLSAVGWLVVLCVTAGIFSLLFQVLALAFQLDPATVLRLSRLIWISLLVGGGVGLLHPGLQVWQYFVTEAPAEPAETGDRKAETVDAPYPLVP